MRRTIERNPFVPVTPTPRQGAFLALTTVREVGYGGAAGGGKSAALLMAALQYVETPGYHALLIRRTFADLNLPDALIPLSHEWLSGTPAKWSEQRHQWTFPSGATLTFGYCETARDIYRYQGPAFAFAGWDELTQFEMFPYRYLFSRLRKRLNLPVPLRVRAGFNPGGIGHEWVKRRFIDLADGVSRMFVPARLEDNPYLDREAYEESLDQLDPVTRRQLRHGDWDVQPEGELFKRDWFAGRTIDRDRLPRDRQRVRYWDLAATAPKPGKDPDYAVGCLMSREGGRFYVEDVQRFRVTPAEVKGRVRAQAVRDGRDVSIRIEQEPGASAKIFIDDFARELSAFDLRGVPSLRDKMTRAKPASAACERGDVWMVAGAWAEAFLDELCAFPGAAHDDQVDSFTGAYNELASDEPWTANEVGGVLSYND